MSVTLAKPRRFDRPGYLRAKEKDPGTKSEGFWKDIPTSTFLVMASEISTMNLRYLPGDRLVQPLKRGSPDLTDLLKTIAEQVKVAQAQAAELPKVQVEADPALPVPAPKQESV
jgi:hypothetical protein